MKSWATAVTTEIPRTSKWLLPIALVQFLAGGSPPAHTLRGMTQPEQVTLFCGTQNQIPAEKAVALLLKVFRNATHLHGGLSAAYPPGPQDLLATHLQIRRELLHSP